MNINKSIIEEIIADNFFDNITAEISRYLLDLDSYDLRDIFNEEVEYADLDGINKINLIRYISDDIENQKEISGSSEISINLDGYVYWDKENHLIESVETTFIIDFVFYYIISENEYKDFEITEIYL